MKRIPAEYSKEQVVEAVFEHYFKDSYFNLAYEKITLVKLPPRFDGEELAEMLKTKVDEHLSQPGMKPHKFDIDGTSNVIAIYWYELTE
jgi:hypothetical protein